MEELFHGPVLIALPNWENISGKQQTCFIVRNHIDKNGMLVGYWLGLQMQVALLNAFSHT
jgi:hypothetical protein